MKLIKLEITKLYDRDFEINFNDKLTILYGLNGSGKTTLINIVFNILKGEIKKVLEYKFQKIVLEFEHNSRIRKFEIGNIENKTILKLDEKSYEYHNFDRDLEFIFERSNIVDDESSNNIFEEELLLNSNNFKVYSGKDTKNNNIKEISMELESLSDVIYIPLNRKVKGLEELEQTYKMPRYLVSSNKKNIEDSLQRADRYFELYKHRITKFENRINASMRSQMISNFSSPINSANLLSKSNDFTNLETELKDIFGEKISININKILEIYYMTFDSFVINEGKIEIIQADNFVEHNFALAQLSKLSEVSNVAKKEKKQIDKLKQNIEQVLSSINLLFAETRKKIGFDERNNNLYFENLDSKKPNKLDISHLSSGEKQLVIFFIFALIDINVNQKKLLFIDEPELSLHIEWQSRLLPLIINSNNTSQIIIATHSPDIIGDYHENCVEVRGRLS